MTAQKGAAFLLKIGDGNSPIAYATVAGLRTTQMTVNGYTVVVTHKQSGGWRDLLSLTWIRQGPDSQAWADYLEVIDSLQAFGEDPQMEINLPELLRLIQDGLASISGNHMPSSRIREELKRFLVRSPEQPPEMVDVPEAEPEPDALGREAPACADAGVAALQAAEDELRGRDSAAACGF